ncbi:MAG: hypothetical protein K6F05_02995 [Succinivibrio sp.]|nr:hypothetical protein [Succinivibrio sp.]
MNLSELEHLRSPSLSHQSRSLYLLYLRPLREQGEICADLYAICNYLSVPGSRLSTQVSLQLAEACLDELFREGLIAPLNGRPNSSWQNTALSLPLYEAELNRLPARVFRMTQDWRPSANFKATCTLCGLETASFTDRELHGFCSYWSGTTELRNQAAWERAFALRLKKQRSARLSRPAAQEAQAREPLGHPMAERSIPRAEGSPFERRT